MKCWERKLLPRDAEGRWEGCDHPSKKRSDCRRVKGDGYLSKKKTKKQKTGLGFLSHEKKQTEVYAADITSAVLISCYLIFQTLNMLQEALVSCSNPLAFLFSISRTISIISFSCEKARDWKFPGVFKGWAPLRSIQEQPHLDMSSLDPEFIFFKTWNWRLVPKDTLNSQYHLTSGW